MNTLELTVLGCGCAVPTVRHNPSAQVLNVHGKTFLIDCGEGTQLQLRRCHVSITDLRCVFISHLHGDHYFGLIGLLATMSLLGRTSSLHIYSFPELERLIRPVLEFQCGSLGFALEFHALREGVAETIYEDSSVTVATLPLNHRVPASGFLFEERAPLPHIRRDMIDFLSIPYYEINAIKAGAEWTTPEGRHYTHAQLTRPARPPRSYAYVSDTEPLPDIADRCKGVSLMYHEATFAGHDAARARQTGHSTAREAAEAARAAGAGRLMLGHFSARYTDENVLLDEARAVFPETILAREGLRIEV